MMAVICVAAPIPTIRKPSFALGPRQEEVGTSFVSPRAAVALIRTKCQPKINHQKAYSDGEACTNQAENYFSRLRRAEMGHHHHVSGPYFLRYAKESAWREDARRVDNGAQVRRVTELALHRGPSIDFAGYYQRHVKVA